MLSAVRVGRVQPSGEEAWPGVHRRQRHTHVSRRMKKGRTTFLAHGASDAVRRFCCSCRRQLQQSLRSSFSSTAVECRVHRLLSVAPAAGEALTLALAPLPLWASVSPCCPGSGGRAGGLLLLYLLVGLWPVGVAQRTYAACGIFLVTVASVSATIFNAKRTDDEEPRSPVQSPLTD
jgi:hypothetical protein